MSQSNIFYCLVAVEYGKRNFAKSRRWCLGENDNYRELYNLFVHFQCQSSETFFEKFPKDVYQVQVLLEECQETKNGIECIQIKNEMWVKNPNYKGGIENVL